MRTLIHALSILAVVALAFWAYDEGYRTRATERAVRHLQAEIGARHEELAVLRSEWAYLNRPDRLHALAEMNFESLELMPLGAEHYGRVAEVAFPPPPLPLMPWQVEAAGAAEKLAGLELLSFGEGIDAGPAIIAPPALAEDGEQLP